MFEKMSIIQLMMYLSEMISEYSKEGVYPAHICIWHKKLEIHFCGHTNIQHPTFLKLTRHRAETGFNRNEWKILSQSIYNYARRNEPCQKQSKH